jgi:hypothetical protein
MYLQVHPEAKKWRNMPFFHYDELQALVEGRYTTGECAYQVSLASDNENNDATPTEDAEDVDNDAAVSQSTDAASQVSQYHCCSPAYLIASRSTQVTTADAVSSQPPRRKRAISSSPPPSFLPLKRPRSSPRGPAVVQGVANAIREFSESVSNTAAVADTPSTPQAKAGRY